jgi:hypothetical protein
MKDTTACPWHDAVYTPGYPAGACHAQVGQLPLLPTLWGGLAADVGVYRSFAGGGYSRLAGGFPRPPSWQLDALSGPTWTPNAGPS